MDLPSRDPRIRGRDLTVFHQSRDKTLPRIKAFLQKYPNSLRCDQCISNGLRMSGRRAVWRHTSLLEGSPDFMRKKGVCPQCGETRLLTGLAPAADAKADG